MNSSKTWLLLSAAFLLCLLEGSCDCGSATGPDCYRDRDCPECYTCRLGKCVPAREICGDGMDNDCDGITDDDCENLCQGVVCLSPPSRECLDDKILKFYNVPGYCVEGECVYSSTERTCEEGCVDDHCNEDFCIGLHCNDNNPCTDDSCNPLFGCTYLANSDKCEDGNLCTTADLCVDGSCRPGPARNCDDGVDCTVDSCNPAEGCVNRPYDSDCDDGNPCTDDVCDPRSGCVNTNNSDPCDDGDPCTMDDTCSEGVCHGVPLDNDGDGFGPVYCYLGGDCDDDDYYTNPDAEEVCNGKDNNCDGLIDMIGTDMCNYQAFCWKDELLFCEDGRVPTVAPGVVDTRAVWCSKNSPYVLEQNLVVLNDTSLVIGPCTHIEVNDGLFFNLRGLLVAKGDPDYPVLFTSASSSPTRGSWDGIRLQQRTNATIHLHSSIVEYANEGLAVGHCGSDCTVFVSDCVFQHNEYAIRGYPWGEDEVIEIMDSKFLDNTYGTDQGFKVFRNCLFSGNDYGVWNGERVSLYNCTVTGNVIGLEGGRGTVENCRIANNTQAGVTTLFEGYELIGNTIVGNKIGVIASDYDGQVSPASFNTICNNTDYDISLDTSFDLDATSNWWCTTDPEEIRSRIFDVYDDANLGLVRFEPFLEEEP